MVVTVVGTAFLTLAAAVDPLLSFFGAASSMMGNLAKCFSLGGVVGNSLGTLRQALWVRFQIIFMNRTKAAAVQRLQEAKKTDEAKQGEEKAAISPEAAALSHQVAIWQCHVMPPAGLRVSGADFGT